MTRFDKDRLKVAWLALGLICSFSLGVVMMSELWADVVVESGYAERVDGSLEWRTCK